MEYKSKLDEIEKKQNAKALNNPEKEKRGHFEMPTKDIETQQKLWHKLFKKDNDLSVKFLQRFLEYVTT